MHVVRVLRYSYGSCSFIYVVSLNFMKKKPFNFGSRIVSILFVVILLFNQSCGSKKYTPMEVDPAFAGYVISFTSGLISKASHISVRLLQEVPNVKAGDQLKSNPFSFSPKIKGKAVWKDAQTIEFIPDQKMKSGKVYTVSFKLHKFHAVSEKLKVLRFNFLVMKQGVQYDFNGMEPYSETDKTWQKVKGVFTTADFAEPAEIENAVEASSKNGDYKISWEHSPDGTTHSFSIDSIQRTSKPFDIKLRWKGKEIGAKKTKSELIVMPSIDVFKVIDVKVEYRPSSKVRVFFSDPLSKDQDITGLIFLNPSGSESIVVHGTEASLFLGTTLIGGVNLTVKQGVKNIFEETLDLDYSTTLHFASRKPEVEFLGDGVIIPNSDGILLPFKAISLKAVDVTIVKIFENNIPYFLQNNQLDGSNEIKRVGRVVYKKEVLLISEENINYDEWNTFSLELSKLINPEPGAIYRVEINFRQKHSLYPCAEADLKAKDDEYQEEQNPNEKYDQPNEWGYYDDEDYEYYDYEDYNWQDRENPCKSSYYANGSHKIVKNVLASNMGIIAKAGTNSEYFVTVTDLRDTDPLHWVEVEFRNLQNQVMGTVKTNSDGMCSLKLAGKPFLIIAKDGKQRGYLRVDDGSSLSLSMFDVTGVELVKGLKGFMYGERGVWRPGDSLYISFILEDKNKQLPSYHPVVMELYTPDGQLSQRLVRTTNLNGFYSFTMKTPDDAPTGQWLSKCKVGGAEFSKSIRIETVKPNRLKINLKYPVAIFSDGKTETGDLQVDWLHGTPAGNLKVQIDATLASTKSEFNGFKDYIFDDPTKQFVSKSYTLFHGTLNNQGNAKVNTKFEIEKNTPGLVTVQLITKAFEAGGDFSIDRFIMKYSPYSHYVGIKIPKGKEGNALYSNEKNLFPIVSIDQNGKPINKKLKVEIFEVYWRWWWDRSAEDNLADFISNQNSKLLTTDYITTQNGKAMYEMNLGSETYGRKFIRVSDEEGGHTTGAVFYTTYKGWWSNAGSENPGGAEMLIFQTDKSEYKVGEKVTVELPFHHKGRALISIESGTKVLQNFWVIPDEKSSKFTFEATAEMSPNIYVHVTYIQPHTKGDVNAPIRMYGVQAVKIENPNTHLTPVISMNKTLKPLEKFTVKIKEKSGKPMTYTIAIVDEGLLDLTRFKTPDPWNAFYAHEALGVKTWDLYKYVAGAYTGKLAGLLAIGGDEFLNKKGKENNNRFKSVVLYQGPISIKAGETKVHEFMMPNYVGSVKVMVVAGQEGAYGNAEQAVPVKQSLMILPTLPRVVSPTEIISVPVTVFAMEAGIKDVTVTLATNPLFEIVDGSSKVVTFKSPGDQTIEFKIKVKSQIGAGKVSVTAVSGTHKAISDIDLQVRVPNPATHEIISAVIEPGKTWNGTVKALGITGTNSGMIEISNMYPLNLENRLQFLITYPHGCIEQIVSAAFPQLFLPSFVELTPAKKQEVETNIKACLAKLPLYKHSSGGFSYWPGETYAPNEWGTNFAGHFMLEAQALGYALPIGILESWIQHQTKEANNWRESAYHTDDLSQAYRLYTLALAKNPALSAMNRLRETKNVSNSAKWRLAAAYAIIGKTEISQAIIQTIKDMSYDSKNYQFSYGSSERDMAMTLETLVLMKDFTTAKSIAIDVAKALSSNQWMSTQTTAYSLIALAKYANKADQLICSVTVGSETFQCDTKKPIWQKSISFGKSLSHQVSITNKSKYRQFLQIQLSGVPLMKATPAKSENLNLTVNYFDMKGNPIKVNALKQGTDFYAEVTVKHPGLRFDYQEMAVEQLFPSGWEIVNTRMDEVGNLLTTNPGVRYQDFRDDRVYSYFTLAKGEKKTFRILLHAAYVGDFYLPSVYGSEMYDNTIYASTPGEWIKVVKK